MKAIMSLLVLFINIGYTTVVAAQTNHVRQTPLARQLQVDRYTGYRTNATMEEVNPLLVITQINFPSHVKTVHDAIEHALQRSGYRVDWQQSAEARDVFSELAMPIVHRKLSLMTLKDAIATLVGEAWQLLIDSVNRKLLIQLHDGVSWQIASDSKASDTLRSQRGAATAFSDRNEANRESADVETSVQAIVPDRRNTHFELSSQQIAPSVDEIYYAPLVASTERDPDREVSALSVPKVASEVEMTHQEISVNSIANNLPYEDFNTASKRNVLKAKAMYYGTPDSIEVSELSDFMNVENLSRDAIDLYDEKPHIHRVQYMPEVQSKTTELLKEEPAFYERPKDQNLWSVQPVIKAKEGVGSLDETVIVHYGSISVKELIEILIPKGWVVHYEVSDAVLEQKLVSHAESSRRSALLSLFKELNLKALFYPGQAVVLVTEKNSESFGYNRQFPIKTKNNRIPNESSPNMVETSELQPEVDAILENAKIIKSIMNKMSSVPK